MRLANTYRPQSLEKMIGQQNLVGANGILTNMLKNNHLSSAIFYGPPGSGKTTAARILANKTNLPFHSMNGITFSTAELKKLLAKETKSPFLLYLDEIQYLNRKQQQTLLPFIEEERFILLAATTENPYYAMHNAVLSRCILLGFKPIATEEIKDYLQGIAKKERPNLTLTEKAMTLLANQASGDLRRALNELELLLTQKPNETLLKEQDVKELLPTLSMAGFDPKGDYHYQYVSALQKSIRGSDPNAAIFYLSKLLEGGDILSPARRLLVIACEDIGLANPNAITQTVACITAAERLGLPEAYYPLSEAALLLALSPKSNSIGNTFTKAKEAIQNGKGVITPPHIASEHPINYQYPHDYPNHWVNQQYLPTDLQNETFYTPGDNPLEEQAKTYWDYIKNQTKTQ